MLVKQQDGRVRRLDWVGWIKFLYPVILSLLSLRLTHNLKYVFCCAGEAAITYIITCRTFRNSIFRIISALVLLGIIYVQVTVLFFVGTYTSAIMLDNLESISALSGKLGIYVTAIVVDVVVLLLPLPPWQSGNRPAVAVCFVLLAGFLLTFRLYSGVYNVYIVGKDMYMRRGIEILSAKHAAEGYESNRRAFYSEGVRSGTDRPAALKDRPNIVLIFTEGLSNNIIDDSRDIMPRVRMYREEGITFKNYFNHTAATYRGIIGQLFSACQNENTDSNPLISLQSILSAEGYHTTMINSEPNNETFTAYLKALGFDDCVNTEPGVRSDLSDREIYEQLFDYLAEGERSGVPQLLVTYTFGTHVTFDSPDVKFQDGSNWLLNRFHNLDAQFGAFLDRVKASGYYDNTIVVFTTDHATYVDDDFAMAFPGYARTAVFCDSIPLVIGYSGVEHAEIDVHGRNTLDLAPTLLDFLDMEAHPNYFLGTSLFQDQQVEEMETVFSIPSMFWYYATDDGTVRDMDLDSRGRVMDRFAQYMALMRLTEANAS